VFVLCIGLNDLELIHLLKEFDLEQVLERSGGLDVDNGWIWYCVCKRVCLST
jgi:hypothetical protein